MNIIYTVGNQKGGCGKTTLTLNLGVALAEMGYKVLLIDLDGQANMTMALGCHQPDSLPVTMFHVMQEVINAKLKPEQSELVQKREYILKSQGVDFIPSSIELTGIENTLITTINRENVLKKFINFIKNDYQIILIDTMPALSTITINAINAADRILIPMQPQFFSAKGLELLLATIANLKDSLNPNLEIEGALITMYDGRIKFHKEVIDTLTEEYGRYFRIFETKIPISVRVTETQARSRSIFDYDPNGKIAENYRLFARELMGNE